MEELSIIKYLFFKSWLGILKEDEVDKWISQLSTNQYDLSQIYPHLNLKKNRIDNSIVTIAKMLYPEFKLESAEGEQIAKLILIEYSEKYLKKAIEPKEFCEVSKKIEDLFINYDNEVPPWLGELWNACDWCDETWSHLNSDELTSEVRRNLEDIKEKGFRSDSKKQ